MSSPKNNQQITLDKLQIEEIDTMLRNEAIAQLMGFKRYLPSKEIKKVHELQYPLGPMQWFFVPGIGRYNSFELKFHKDYNWLISAIIELKKYKGTHKGNVELSTLFNMIAETSVLDIDMKFLWTAISDYAITLFKQKQIENKPYVPVNNSDEWYKILYPDKNVVVMDPDGWDRKNWQFSWYEELITAEEFNNRLMKSTTFRERNNI